MFHSGHNKKAQHRPASQDVAHQQMHQHETMTNNLMPINQPVVYNFNPQNNAQASQQSNNRRNLDRKQQYTGASGESQGSTRNSQHTGVRGVGKPAGGPQQMAHSMTRDLDGMGGLLTQVKKGDDMRNQKKNPRQGQTNSGQQANSQTTKYSAMVTRQQAPKQNLNMANQQLTQQNMFFLLKPQTEAMRGRKTLLLDVDETLVHSTFTQTDKADIVLPIDIEGRACNIFVQVRPGCQEFIKEVGKHYEVAIFTASLSKYANPLMDILDPERVAPQRLFREHCTFYNNQFVKDMQRVGRRMEDIMILDNSPNCYQFQQENGLPIISWYDDPEDTELMNYLPALRLLSQVEDVRPVILQSVIDNEWNLDLSMKICQSLLILKQQKEQEELEEEQQQKQMEMDAQQQRQAAYADQMSSGPTRKSGAGSFLNSEQNHKTSEQRTPEIDSIKRNNDRSGGYNQTSSWINRNNDLGQQPNLSAKKDHFSSSGKKSQPSQARSFQKNSIAKDVSESGAASTSQRNSQITQQQYETGQHQHSQQQILQQSRQNSQQPQPLQPIVDQNQEPSQHSKIMAQPGPKISNNTTPIHTMPSKQQKIRNAASSSHYDEQSSTTLTATGTNATSSRIASKKVMSESKANGMKLSEYLVKQDQENLGESQQQPSHTTQFKRVSSRNKNTEAALSGSHRNIHTLSHLLIKPQNNFNSKSGSNDQSGATSNVNSQHVSYQTANYSKTISALKPNSTLVNGNNRNGSAVDGVRATNGIRNGSKRRANSNNVQDKKVNLDKFLSVVQQRYNYTNTHHASSVNQLSNTRNIAPKTHHISKPTDEKTSSRAQQQHSGSTSANAQNQQPISHHSTKNSNLERKKVGQMRISQFNSNSELPYSQQSQHTSKKMHNLKVATDHHRDSANKTTGARGVQLNQNNIIFSKNMNLSQILQEKTKNNLAQSSAGKQQTNSTSDVKKMSTETQQQLGGTQRNLITNTVPHKSQKSTINLQHTQQLQSSGTSGLSQLSSPQLHSSKTLTNPYTSATKASSSGIQSLIQGGNSRNSSVKYNSSKLNSGSQGSSRHQQTGNSSLTLKRMSAGNSNNDGGKHVQNTATGAATSPHSLNSRVGQRKIKACNTNASTTAKKYAAQSQLINSNNNDNQQRQSMHQKSLIDENSSSQLFIRMSGSQNKSQQVHQHNQAATVKHKSQTRSSANQQDYNRSPGRIFNANVSKSGASQQANLPHHSGSQTNNKISSSGKQNSEFATIASASSKVAGAAHAHQQSNNQLINKRSSKPQLMSELNMTLKNKKINQITTTSKASDIGGYQSFRKPLVSAGRSPQTTKNGVVTTQIDNFTGHSYTQRVVAANVQNQGRNRQGHMYQGRQQHPIDQPRTQAAAMPDSIDLSQSASIVTPRKKVLKLISSTTQGNSGSGQQMQFNTAASLSQQTGSAVTNVNFTDPQSKNSKKAGSIKNTSAKLLTNFYQQHHRQIKDGSLDVGSMSSQQQQPQQQQQLFKNE